MENRFGIQYFREINGDMLEAKENLVVAGRFPEAMVNVLQYQHRAFSWVWMCQWLAFAQIFSNSRSLCKQFQSLLSAKKTDLAKKIKSSASSLNCISYCDFVWLRNVCNISIFDTDVSVYYPQDTRLRSQNFFVIINIKYHFLTDNFLSVCGFWIVAR